MRKLRRFVYLSLHVVLGTLTVVPLSEYSLMIIFGTFALLFVARQVNFYKIVMILKHFIQNTRKLHFENRLKLRTGFRGYRDSELEKSG